MSNDPWRLDGMLALVTGGTKGIGLAIAQEFTALGANVITVARGEGATVAADVATDAGRDAVMAEVTARGRLDVLVNNVGTNIRKATADFTADDLRSILDTNLASAWELTRRCLPMLRESGGNVVNISSTVANVAVSTSTTGYAMTKAAMDQMTRCLAVEWGPTGVRVNSVQPWYIKTPLVEQVLGDPVKRELIESATPMPRLGEPTDIAKAVAFLASSDASWITGVCLPVDGGMLAKGV